MFDREQVLVRACLEAKQPFVIDNTNITRESRANYICQARAAGIRPEEAQLGALAASLEAMLATIERCEALNLAEHEPATALRLSGGAVDAEL